MNTTFFQRASIFCTLAAVAVIFGASPARAENTNFPAVDKSDSRINLTTNQSEQINVIPATPAPTVTTETRQPQTTQNLPSRQSQELVQLAPGRATRSGSSYLGVAGNIGITGDTRVGEGSFSVISKIGLTRNLSIRPAALIGDNTAFLVPITVDFPLENLEITRVGVAPYIGGGVAISTGRDSTVGGLITGGLDVPLSPRITATSGVNVSFIDKTDVGVVVGVGYNF